MNLPKILKSRKFLTLVSIVAVIMAEDCGLVSPGAATKIQLSLGTYLGSVAITGAGKEAAKVKAS